MERFKAKLEEIRKQKYTLTKSKVAISQKERNQLKYELTEAFVDDVVELCQDIDLWITKTVDGYIIEVQNDELGMIPVELGLKVRSIKYDINAAEEELLNKK